MVIESWGETGCNRCYANKEPSFQEKKLREGPSVGVGAIFSNSLVPTVAKEELAVFNVRVGTRSRLPAYVDIC